MRIGTMELVVIILIAILVLGPESAAVYAKKFGKGLRVFKVYLESLSGDLQESVVEPVREMQKPLQEIAKPVTQMTESIQAPIEELNQSLRDTLKTLESPEQLETVTEEASEENAFKEETIPIAADSNDSTVVSVD